MASGNYYNPGLVSGVSGVASPDYGTASSINSFMTQQAAAPYLANLPNYAQLTQKSSDNILSNLSGEVPQDVLELMQQQAAERGVATGSPGSPNTNAAYLRALGLTSLGLKSQGEQELTGAVNRTPVPQLYNPASLYVPQTLANQELAAAQSGNRTAGGGGVTYTGGGGGGNFNQPYRASDPMTPQVVGRMPGRFDDNGWGSSQIAPTYEAIQKIANGQFDDSWSIQDDPASPMIGSDIPDGTWYNPQDETFNEQQYGMNDYTNYFE